MNESLNQTTNSPTRQPSLDFSSPFFPPDPPVAPVAPTHQSSPDFSSPFLPPLASTPTPIPTPAPPPPPPPPTTTNTLNTNLQSNILTYVLQSNPLLIPTTLSRNARLTSTRINDIAHAMWNVAFTHDDPLQRACQYAAMFSPLKLAALAKLNFLPSWWFFRDLALKGLQERGWEVDDAEMEETWEEAVRWCVEVNGRKGGK
ncbi:hypothetical protein COCCADRAFT_87310 [Bipolaris zeicola 26-R-13]|uniref:Uncharacterized protein n=1 Tax=Cochliobolus carbonum (strain 26-R-13) TaxID=930089 RepID=W6YBC7_COCC2|nr:uncharacterized protein COCCADRAFT_87310 [Bipolaris zeicola 26-R-13]EUC36757.1 hypothetical protein COCCADRAFT_87310 [Bipolaris zeicola 26-R-13]